MAEIVERDLVFRVVGCAMEVLNELGHGLREKTYERALCVALQDACIPFSQQRAYPVHFRGRQVDEFVPDLEVADRLVVETKTVEAFTDDHRGQVLNYLRITRRPVGILLNFKHPRLQWERLVLTRTAQPTPGRDKSFSGTTDERK